MPSEGIYLNWWAKFFIEIKYYHSFILLVDLILVLFRIHKRKRRRGHEENDHDIQTHHNYT